MEKFVLLAAQIRDFDGNSRQSPGSPGRFCRVSCGSLKNDRSCELCGSNAESDLAKWKATEYGPTPMYGGFFERYRFE